VIFKPIWGVHFCFGYIFGVRPIWIKTGYINPGDFLPNQEGELLLTRNPIADALRTSAFLHVASERQSSEVPF
jgi:hypothetical protein